MNRGVAQKVVLPPLPGLSTPAFLLPRAVARLSPWAIVRRYAAGHGRKPVGAQVGCYA
jgi:hypothetical protein